MRPFATFGLGLLARIAGLVAAHYAQWLFHQISQGAEASYDLRQDLQRFLRWLVRMLAQQFGGRHERRYSDYEEADQWEPQTFGAR